MLYQVLAAGTTDPAASNSPLPLRPPGELWYLSQSNRLTINGVEDDKGWLRTVDALTSFGVDEPTRLDIMRILCGVLHLGSLQFEDVQNDVDSDASRLSSDTPSQEALQVVGELWGVDTEAFVKSLTTRSVTSRRRSTYEIGMTAAKATHNRDAAAKAVYHELFEFLVKRMNAQFVSSGGPSVQLRDIRWIGLLDAFGFELLQSNSLEQLLINATNEVLQQFFLKSVMNAEAALYEAEQISWSPIEYKDNASTIALMRDKPEGLMSLLDEETRLPNGTDERFATRVMEQLQKGGHEQKYTAYSSKTQLRHGSSTGVGRLSTVGGARLSTVGGRPSTSGGEDQFHGSADRRQRTMRNIRDLFMSGTPHFTVKHFAGEVCYEVVNWLDKNADILFEDIRTKLLASTRPLMVALFKQDVAPNGQEDGSVKPPPLLKKASSVVSAPTICTRFSQDLDLLMKELKLSTVHFVRCVKPNNELTPNAPDSGVLLDQLLFSGMLEAVQVSLYLICS